MPSKAQQNAGAPLPETITGYELISFCGQIPNAREYRAALYGAISTLTKWWHWEKGGYGDTRATEAAQYMRETLLETFSISEECVFDCEDVEECIRTNPGVIDAIIDVVGGTGTEGRTEEITETALTGGEAGCDLDLVFGRCSELWAYINARSLDFLEQLNEAAIAAERASLLIRSIPGFGELPIDEAVEWLANLPKYGYIAYLSQLTTELEVDIKCGLFCLAVENDCRLTFGMVYDFFTERLGGVNMPTAIATFLEWVEFMVLGEYPTDRIIYMLSAWQLSLAFMGAEFLGVDSVRPYAIRVAVADPDDDWTLLCDECACAYVSYDNAETDAPYTIEYGTIDNSGNPANCNLGEYWTYEDGGNTYEGQHAYTLVDLEQNSTVTRTTNHYYYTKPEPYPTAVRRSVHLFDAAMVELAFETEINNPGEYSWREQEFEFDSVENVRYVQFRIHWSTHQNYEPGHVVKQDNLRVYCSAE